jgi:protein kinase C substrate 80K-H
MLADHFAPGSESKAVTAARDTYTSIAADVANRQNELSDKQADLTKDYGPDNVFRAIKDTCISQDSGEYTYELCWLSKTTQISKKGGGHTNMGNFNRLERIMVDEEEGKDGRGLGKGERLVMVYEGGQQCWNGPQRSTVVVLKCWERDEVWKVVEAEKCVYRMEVGTPAVCEGGAVANTNEGGKDEL